MDEKIMRAPLPAGAREDEPLDAHLQVQLARIRAMDPEMEDLNAIIGSAAGQKFREYVDKGLDFVDAYTLAARERLQELRDRRTAELARNKAAGKEHLSATNTRGRGSVTVPAAELAIIRALLPDATDEEIRRYYAADRKKFGK